ncbi:hypothetical protein AURDEDRAFT_183238 [Auricularia subglabra TFB-10046 SS5]|nr:hypothetical protein AURDEDRAFT_183238 [Auricularia subglabra TFB-10046 SS5]
MNHSAAPANNAGVPLPQPAQTPPSAQDVGGSIEYMFKLLHARAADLPNVPTQAELGEAAQYIGKLVAKSRPEDHQPPWMEAIVQAIKTDIAKGNEEVMKLLEEKFNKVKAEVEELKAEVRELKAEVKALIRQQAITT